MRISASARRTSAAGEAPSTDLMASARCRAGSLCADEKAPVEPPDRASRRRWLLVRALAGASNRRRLRSARRGTCGDHLTPEADSAWDSSARAVGARQQGSARDRMARSCVARRLRDRKSDATTCDIGVTWWPCRILSLAGRAEPSHKGRRRAGPRASDQAPCPELKPPLSATPTFSSVTSGGSSGARRPLGGATQRMANE